MEEQFSRVNLNYFTVKELNYFNFVFDRTDSTQMKIWPV